MNDDSIISLYEELPDFANKENRDVHAEIIKQISQYEALKTETDDLKDRVKVLKEHLKNVEIEVGITNKLVVAKEAQCKEELHLKQVCERERGNIVSAKAQIDEKTLMLNSIWSEVQARMFKAQQRIENFRQESEENEKQLKIFQELSKQKEEDNQVIKKYYKDDEDVIKRLYQKIEKQSGIVEAKRAELQKENTTTRALQIELDTAAAAFRQVHEERAKILQQWETTLTQTQVLNDSIEAITKNIEKRKNDTEKMVSTVHDLKKSLDILISGNHALERYISMSDNKISLHNKELSVETTQLNELNEVVETTRGKLLKLESDERFYNEEISDIKNNILKEYKKKEEYQNRLELTMCALETQGGITDDIEKEMKILADAQERSKSELKLIESQIEVEKKNKCLLVKDIRDLVTKSKSLEDEISGSRNRLKNLDLKINSLDDETQRQNELLYNSNHQIVLIERKIGMLTGSEVNGDEKEVLERRVKELEAEEEQKRVNLKQLQVHLHRIELDLRQSKARKEKLEEKKKEVESELSNISLDKDGLDKEVLSVRNDKEKLLVQLNLLKLQVEKLTQTYESKCDEIISLENRREQLKLSAQEKMSEIESHIATLKVQLKTEEESKHRVIVELAERKRQEKAFESKFAIESAQIIDENGMLITQAEQAIKMAKERQEIIDYGDGLEEEIRKALVELRTLERAMGKFDKKGIDYEEELEQVPEDESDAETRKILEETIKNSQIMYESRRIEAQKVNQEKNAAEKAYEDVQDQTRRIQKSLVELTNTKDKVIKDGIELKEKIKRATLALKNEMKKKREEDEAPLDAPYPSTLREMDNEVRILKWSLDNAVDELLRLSDLNKEIEPRVKLAIQQLGIKMRPRFPNHPVGSSFSSGSSMQSSRGGASLRSGASIRSGVSLRSMASYRSNKSNNSTQSVISNVSVASLRSGNSNQSTKSYRTNNTHISVKQIQLDL